ncbi:hypothetical protein D3C80_1003730 [compost metagenome]
MDHATTALQAQYDFVPGRGEAQQGGDFMAQAVCGRRLDIAIEVEHEHPWLGLGLLLLLLLFLIGLGLLLALGLELVLVEQARLQALAQALVEIVEPGDLQLAGCLAPAFAAQRGRGGQHHDDGDDQGDGLGQEDGVLRKKLHSDSSMLCAPLGEGLRYSPAYRRPYSLASCDMSA